MKPIMLPFPPAEVSPNARLNYRQKADAMKAYREECKVAALNWKREREQSALILPFERARMFVTFALSSLKRRRDWDNLIAAFKAGQDGLVDAGIIADDSIQVIASVHYQLAAQEAKTPVVFVTFTES